MNAWAGTIRSYDAVFVGMQHVHRGCGSCQEGEYHWHQHSIMADAALDSRVVFVHAAPGSTSVRISTCTRNWHGSSSAHDRCLSARFWLSMDVPYMLSSSNTTRTLSSRDMQHALFCCTGVQSGVWHHIAVWLRWSCSRCCWDQAALTERAEREHASSVVVCTLPMTILGRPDQSPSLPSTP